MIIDMVCTIKQVVNCYKILGEAKVTKLEDSEVVKIVKNRKVMRPIVNDYEAFLKDVQEKFKPKDWDEIQKKVQQWQQEGENTTLSASEKIAINKALIDYQRKIENAIKEELAKEIELNISILKEDSATKLLIENSWELNKLDDIEIIL